jgi:hypothetical protein
MYATPPDSEPLAYNISLDSFFDKRRLATNTPPTLKLVNNYLTTVNIFVRVRLYLNFKENLLS